MKNVLLLLLFGFFYASAQDKKMSFENLLKTSIKKTVPIISVQQLIAIKNNVTLLDTREPKEFNVSHIANARNVGFNNFDIKSLIDLPKNTEIVVYCTIGVRSEKIGEKLMAAGFTNVKNLYGSIFEWVNLGNEVVNDQNKPTSKVHTYSKNWGFWLKNGIKIY
jgi:rhodanese-related sulfurtransferase